MTAFPPTIEGFTLDELTASPNPKAKILRHRLLRRSFRAWCEYRMGKIGRGLAAHHLLIVNMIDALVANQLDKRRVMMLMPPGSAKSTYTSMLLPAWFCNVEKFPRDLMLAVSYSYGLVEDFGKVARDILQEETSVLGVQLSSTAQAAGNWRTDKGGGYFCAGINAGIAGRRALLGLTDDYLGSEEEADSTLIRDKNWKWRWNDFLPRLLPQAWEFLIANRRHEDDMVGRLLNHKTAKDWLVIRIPMLAEENDPLGRKVGERLWSEWFTEEQVENAKALPRTWAGLYQQRPSPEEGNYFRKDWLCEYKLSDLPTNLRYYVGSDYAFKKGTDNDRTCFLPCGIDVNGRIWILPQWFWDRVDTAESVEEMLRMAKQFKPIFWFAGRENITGSIAPFLYKRMQESNIYIPLQELSEAKDKQQKAQAIKARMASKMVMFPSFAPGWEKAMHEMLTFPNGLHDDFVDALSKIGQGLSTMVYARKPVEKWDGNVPDLKITANWVQRSHDRRERDRRRELTDV